MKAIIFVVFNLFAYSLHAQIKVVPYDTLTPWGLNLLYDSVFCSTFSISDIDSIRIEPSQGNRNVLIKGKLKISNCQNIKIYCYVKTQWTGKEQCFYDNDILDGLKPISNAEVTDIECLVKKPEFSRLLASDISRNCFGHTCYYGFELGPNDFFYINFRNELCKVYVDSAGTTKRLYSDVRDYLNSSRLVEFYVPFIGHRFDFCIYDPEKRQTSISKKNFSFSFNSANLKINK